MKTKVMSGKLKRGTMEMSVGTMVTIVLLMVVLVLGIFFIQKIFSSGSNAIDSIDSQVQSQIQQLFAQQGTELAIYPTSRTFTLNQGDNGKGFAFAIKNLNSAPSTFTFKTTAIDVSKCPGLTNDVATNYETGGDGTTGLLASGAIFGPNLVQFTIPNTSPLCSMEYRLDVNNADGTTYQSLNFFVVIK